jgi:hypothetical protein
MILNSVTFTGPPINDKVLLQLIPQSLRSLLEQINGFIQFGGGLHVRGVCHEPAWHSIKEAWHGDDAFHRHYSTVSERDVPFAEDCMGDQIFLRGDSIVKLLGETGEIEELGKTFVEFLAEAQADPVQTLNLAALVQFQEQKGELKPGQLLNVYPPFSTEEAQEGVSLAAVPAHERHRFLAELAMQLQDIPDGQQVEIIVKE